MRERFRMWMRRREGKTEATAYNYMVAIDRLSEHYSEATGNVIDIYNIRDPLRLNGIATVYGIGGQYQDMGYYGNGTNRNAIAAYVRFFQQEGNNIEGIDVPQADPVNRQGADPVNEINNFTYERDLKNSLIRQIPELFPGYRIFGNNGEGIEFPIDGRRIDLLLENIEENTLLVIELKADVASDDVFRQISWYLGSLIQNFPDRIIKGIIIAGEIDDSLIRACAITDRIKLMQYDMNILLREI